MIRNNFLKWSYGLCFMLLFSNVSAVPNVVVNNNAAPAEQQQQQPQQPPCSGDMGTSTDPRVPPAGMYTSRNSDGSSNTLYTTGDKKPYYVDNPCNNTNAAANTPPQPQVIVQPPVKP